MIVIVFLASAVLFVKDRTTAVLLYGSLSAVAVVLFSTYAAPDVALAEASIGLVFTLFLYMVTLQHRGKLWFGLVEVERGVDALEFEIVKSYCENHDLDLKVVRVNEKEVFPLLKSGRIEVAAGAFLSNLKLEDGNVSEGFLETKVFEFGDPQKDEAVLDLENALERYKLGKISGFRVDLARVMALSLKSGELPKPTKEIGNFMYTFVVISDDEELLESLNEHITTVKKNGELAKMVERHLK